MDLHCCLLSHLRIHLKACCRILHNQIKLLSYYLLSELKVKNGPIMVHFLIYEVFPIFMLAYKNSLRKYMSQLIYLFLNRFFIVPHIFKRYRNNIFSLNCRHAIALSVKKQIYCFFAEFCCQKPVHCRR